MNDTIIATAMLDRLLHHAHVVNIRGETYRLKDRMKTGVQTVPPANIPSGRNPGVKLTGECNSGDIYNGVWVKFRPAFGDADIFLDFSCR
jgi:hypothetical protein